MGYRTELLLCCIGVNLVTDILLFIYGLYPPRHVGIRIACYGGMFVIAWLAETRDPFGVVKKVISDVLNRCNNRRPRYICDQISVQGKAKVIRIVSHRPLR